VRVDSRRQPASLAVIDIRLDDQEWNTVEVYLSAAGLTYRTRSLNKGSNRVSDRQCLEGILWVLCNGKPWTQLPTHYPRGITCKERLKLWLRTDIWSVIWPALLQEAKPECIQQWAVNMVRWHAVYTQRNAASRLRPQYHRYRDCPGGSVENWRQETIDVFMKEYRKRFPAIQLSELIGNPGSTAL